MKLSSFFIITLLLLAEVGSGQNARFSQIGNTPLLLNPSLSGRFDGQYRIGSLLSWQKTQITSMAHQDVYVDVKFGKRNRSLGDDIAYSSDSAANAKLNRKKNPREEAKDETYSAKKKKGYWSAGLNYYHYGTDLLGIYSNVSPIRADFYALAIAHHFYLNNNKYFGIGAQMTYANGNIDETRGTKYDKEISGGGFRYDNKAPFNHNSSANYTDYSVGAYFGQVTDQVSYELGLAMNHLFYPHDDIFNKDSETWLRHTMTLHSVLRFKVSKKWAAVQKNVYWGEGLYWRSTTIKDSLNIISLWTGIEFYKTQPLSNVNLNFGFYSRSFKTIMPMAILGIGPLATIRATYEFPINSARFKAYTAKRTEISALFTINRNTATGTRIYKKFNYW